MTEPDQFTAFSQAALRIRRILWAMVILVAVTSVIIVPVFTLYTTHHKEKARAERSISDLADRLSSFIARNPKTWDLMDERLTDILTEVPCPTASCGKTLHLINGQPLLTVGSPPDVHTMYIDAVVTDGIQPVARISFQYGMFEIFYQAAFPTGIGIFISFICFLIFWFYPVRLIEQALKLIDNSQRDLKAQFHAATQSQQLAEAANRAKSEFLATMNHELRTPLTSIKGSLGLLKGLKADELSSDSLLLIDMAERNSNTLIMLINDLLDFEKIMSGTMTVSCSPHKIAALIRAIIETNIGYAETHKVNFITTALDETAWGLIDEGRFSQVIRNLLSNAAKFSKPGDNIEISVIKIRPFVRISVKDYGAGIDQAFQPIMFDRFTQANSADNRHAGGTGLGLSISKALTESMGGHLNFKSQTGLGSTFHVDIRLVEPPST